MSAISDYLHEQSQQLQLLSMARKRDVQAFGLASESSQCKSTAGMGRRILTRRDLKLIESSRSERSGGYITMPLPRFERFLRSFSRGTESLSPGGLSKEPDGNRCILKWHRLAVAEATAGGTVVAVVPILTEATEAFFALLESYREWADGADFAVPFDEIHRRYIVAREKLNLVAPIEVALASNDARNKFCYEEWQAGKTLQQIWVATRRHPEWESLGDSRAVRGPIKAWAEKNGLPIRKGDRGRKPSGPIRR